MTALKCLTAIAAAAFAFCGFAAPAAAQITTGTVTGTVKDAQGGVIPGATVMLISEARGTSSCRGDHERQRRLRLRERPADTYTVEVTMGGFKTLKRSGIVVGAGQPRRGRDAHRSKSGRSPRRSRSRASRRSSSPTAASAPSRSRPNRSRTSRSPTAASPRSRCSRPASTTDGNNTPQRIGGGGDPNIMMDGVSTMDTGSNRPLLQMNVESIAEVKVLTSGYQAEYGRASGVQVTAVTKSGTNRFRGSVYDVERNSDWNSNSRPNMLNGDPKTDREGEAISGYSIGGPVGKPGGSNKLFFFYSQEFSPRTARQQRRAITGCRRRSSARATSRRRPTTTATRIRTSGIRALPAPARATEPGGLLRATAASSAGSRRTGSIRPG